ncbi:MAG: hypothetical protein AAF517_21055 [Planctomycetota bacterium]
MVRSLLPMRCLAFCALLALSSSCVARLPGYSTKSVDWPNKDQQVVTVFVDEKLEPSEYLAIVDRELQTLRELGELGYRAWKMGDDFVAIPLYELRFEFYVLNSDATLSRRVARVSLFADAVPSKEPGTRTALGTTFSREPVVVLY